MFTVHKMVTSTERDEMCIIGRSRNWDGAGAPNIGMTHLIGELLELISGQIVIIPKHMIVGGTWGALEVREIVEKY